MSAAAVDIGVHVRAQDEEGRYDRGWVVAADAYGRVCVDRANECGQRTGLMSTWLTAPEACAPYVRTPSPYEPDLVALVDGLALARGRSR